MCGLGVRSIPEGDYGGSRSFGIICSWGKSGAAGMDSLVLRRSPRLGTEALSPPGTGISKRKPNSIGPQSSRGGGGDFPFLPRFPFNYQHSYRSQAVRTAPDSRARLREPGLERESLRGEQVRQDAAGLGRKKITALFGALRVTELNCAPFPPGREPGRRAGDANGEAARKARKLQAGK